MTAYMANRGSQVLAHGWTMVAIRPGTKAPLGLDWRKRPVTSTSMIDAYEHEYWADKAAKIRGTRTWSIREFGIGLLCDDTPGVDLDIRDPAVAQHMIDFTRTLLGDTIERVGMAPKTLLVYRTDTPFAKVNSASYIDAAGQEAKVEILGAGQQFVALAVHPDTHQPYRWKGKKGPHNTAVGDLPTITHAQAVAIRDEFDRIAGARGWSIKGPSSNLVRVGNTLDDDPFADMAPKVVGVAVEELHRLTMLVPGYDEYESWREIGMALYHQFDGSDEGLEIWDEWSQLSARYDGAAVRDKWPSFDIDGKGRAPLTARVILERSKEAEEKRIAEQVNSAVEAIMAARDVDELEAACLPLKSISFSELTRNMLVGKLQHRYKMVTTTPLGKPEARAMLRYRDAERSTAYPWLAGYVYVQADDIFYNVLTTRGLTPRSFDATYSRFLMPPGAIEEGKSKPDALPVDVARNVAQVPVVSRRMYMPGFDDLFAIDGEDLVNKFSRASLPDAADDWTVAGRAAVERVESHSRFLFSNERDRGLFLDFLAYIVQTNDRVSWTPFIQGVGGDGKGFWGAFMRSVLGMRNVGIIRGTDLQERYTSWGEGSLFVMVEEVRLTGPHRYDAVNNLKPYITDSVVPIRRMQTDIYSVINRTSYVMTSNFKDGLPATEGDRYFPLYSRWQDADLFEAWKQKNPSYFAELFEALNEAPSLRRWLLERKLSPEFNARGRAPESSDREEMRHLVRDDDSAALKAVLDEGKDADFSRALLDSTLLADRMVGSGGMVPVGRRMAQMMSQQGLTFLGESRFGGRKRRWWSNQPDAFRYTDTNGLTKINTSAIESYLENYL